MRLHLALILALSSTLACDSEVPSSIEDRDDLNVAAGELPWQRPAGSPELSAGALPLGAATYCSIADQDCAEGRKCAPAQLPLAGGSRRRCVPISTNPGAPGEGCSLVDTAQHGTLDTCDLGLVCVDGACAVLCDAEVTCPGGESCHPGGSALGWCAP